MPRYYSLAAHQVNTLTTISVIDTLPKIPTDEEYFNLFFESDNKNFGVVVFKKGSASKTFILNLDLPIQLNNFILRFEENKITLDELLELFNDYNIDLPY